MHHQTYLGFWQSIISSPPLYLTLLTQIVLSYGEL